MLHCVVGAKAMEPLHIVAQQVLLNGTNVKYIVVSAMIYFR